MKITVRIDGEDKTFTNDFVKARVFRNALMLNEEMKEAGNDISVELFDKMVSFVVTVFDNRFTFDEFYDGIEAGKLQDEIMRIFNNVINVAGMETVTPEAEGK